MTICQIKLCKVDTDTHLTMICQPHLQQWVTIMTSFFESSSGHLTNVEQTGLTSYNSLTTTEACFLSLTTREAIEK